MSFINNKKFNEIYEASKSGNEKALMIMQALQKNDAQDVIDGLMDDYYRVPVVEPVIAEEELAPVENQGTEPVLEEEPVQEEMVPEQSSQVVPTVDISADLDREMEGLLDENDIPDYSFSDYLKDKQRDGVRAQKNNAFFGAFDVNGRQEYLNKKIDEYTKKFDGNRRDIERLQNDMNKSLEGYTQDVNSLLDDDVELDMNATNQAYKDLTGNQEAMKSFSRFWDENDNNLMINTLRSLVLQYGKKNVLAVLNQLKTDSDNYSKYRNSQIDTETGRYSKSIKELLQ